MRNSLNFVWSNGYCEMLYKHVIIFKNLSKHKTIFKGYNWKKSAYFHHAQAFYEIIDTGFVVLTPSISILFTLGQFVAQNYTVSVNRL